MYSPTKAFSSGMNGRIGNRDNNPGGTPNWMEDRRDPKMSQRENAMNTFSARVFSLSEVTMSTPIAFS